MRRTCLLVVATLAGLLQLPAFSQDKRPIRIATEGAFPPFNFLENGEPKGFEVELGQAICAAVDADCAFVVHEWEGIIKGLEDGEYDAIMASLAITKRRKARIAFSRRYYRIPASFIGRKDAEAGAIDPAALAGRTVGTTVDSEHARFLAARYPGAEVRTYTKFEEANLDLLTGRIDFVLGDRLALSRFLKSREGKACCHLVADAPPDPEFYGEGVAVGLRKADKELKETFDRGIGLVIASGAYDRIREKYFGFDVK